MTIDEAIKILENLLKRYDFIDSKETHAAVKLGIGALEWRQRFVNALPGKTHKLLPGETKE